MVSITPSTEIPCTAYRAKVRSAARVTLSGLITSARQHDRRLVRRKIRPERQGLCSRGEPIGLVRSAADVEGSARPFLDARLEQLDYRFQPPAAWPRPGGRATPNPVGLGCSSGNGPARGRTVRRGLFDAALLADPHGVHDQAGYEPQDDEIEEHLECDDHPGGLTLCCDVTESDRREDRG